MSIQPIGFLDTSMFTARYLITYAKQAKDGILDLRIADDDGDIVNAPVLKEWNSGRALLSRIRSRAAPFFGNRTPQLGLAWIESLDPLSGTPWRAEPESEGLARLRTCLVPSPGAISHSGQQSALLSVGLVNLIDHRALCCEVNHGENARVHLVVDVRIPDDPDA